MVFSSTVFLFLFLPLLIILYYLPIKGNFKYTWRNIILLFFSLGFYAWGEPTFIFVMIGSVFINWLLTLQLSKSKNKKMWLSIIIVLDVLLLGLFKYTTFITNNLNTIFDRVPIVNIALPIGISFFTFQMMSYVFDVYYGYSKVQKNPFYVLLYISFFPQLVAGPIVRYQDIEDQIKSRNESLEDFSYGVKRFVYGLAKKMLLANYLTQIADNVFDYLTNSPISVATAWLGIIAYTLQIYFDFSGYSDMAIGLGKMFGFHFLENFNYPYIASSVTNFWRRWHISLSTWFKDYVYIPLGGNRCSKPRWIFNLFIVWSLTGIWHGANWTFVVWGMFYFVFLLIEKLLKLNKKNETRPSIYIYIYTLLVVMIAWVFFRSESISSAIKYIGYLFGIGTYGFVDSTAKAIVSGTYIVLIVAIIGSTPLISKLFNKLNTKCIYIEQIYLIIIFILCLLQVVSSTYNPFIYFNF